MRRVTLRVLVLGSAASALVGAGVLAVMRRPALTPAVRGEALARQAGCFGCHGPAGRGGQPNPGARAGYVPALKPGGAILYYVQDPAEIREWIRDGAPRRHARRQAERADVAAAPRTRAIEAGPASGTPGDAAEGWSEEPGEDLSPADGLLRMPAYGDHFTESELDDLVAFVRSISLPETPVPAAAAEGLATAQRLGCFACHGEGGRGGLPNPGSFVGIIPPWDSTDFPHLVETEAELREWILDGVTERFANNPAASFFLERQAIQMPSYRGRVSDAELESLIAYIGWLRDPEAPARTDWLEADGDALAVSLTERGGWLYRTSGCATCHGEGAAGGIPNPNAAGGFVPALDDLAEKMNLIDASEAASVVAAIERGDSMERMRAEPPFEPIESFLGRYVEVRDVILKGSKAQKRDADGQAPPMVMPAWRHRAGADDGPASLADADAIIAYLLTLQDWGDEEGMERVPAVERISLEGEADVNRVR